MNPFWNRLKVEVFMGEFGKHLPFTYVKPVTNQQALLAGNHRKLKEIIRKKLVQKKSLIYGKNLIEKMTEI